jgi:hypothetical protein
MNLKKIKIVDLSRSELDEEKSDLYKGEHVFKKDASGKPKMHIIDWKKKPLPRHKVKWGPHAGQDRLEWTYELGFKNVTKEDPYLALGIPLNAEGHYQAGDAVLMMANINKHISTRLEAHNRAEVQAKSSRAKLTDNVPKDAQLTERDKERLHKKYGIY